jgi:hypothetical protein
LGKSDASPEDGVVVSSMSSDGDDDRTSSESSDGEVEGPERKGSEDGELSVAFSTSGSATLRSGLSQKKVGSEREKWTHFLYIPPRNSDHPIARKPSR